MRSSYRHTPFALSKPYVRASILKKIKISEIALGFCIGCVSVVLEESTSGQLRLYLLSVNWPFKAMFWPWRLMSGWCEVASAGCGVTSPLFSPCLFPCRKNSSRVTGHLALLCWFFFFPFGETSSGRKWQKIICVFESDDAKRGNHWNWAVSKKAGKSFSTEVGG